MYKQFYARCTLSIQITTRSPFLIQGVQNPSEAATFFRARDPAEENKEKYCIPATSLKGVWRSTVERILRTFHPQLACDPFDKEAGSSQSCSHRLENHVPSEGAYVQSCPACRMFGSTAHAGLLHVQDAWAVGNPTPLPKYVGIAIDRFTGGAKAHALYQYVALPAETSFMTQVVVENFEFWQLGLFALACREMSAGRARLGSGTRRGRGHVQVSWQKAEFCYPKQRYESAAQGQAGKLAASQVLMTQGERIAYPQAEGWLFPDLAERPARTWADRRAICFEVEGETLNELQKACVEQALADKLRAGLAGFVYSPMPQEVAHA